MTTTAEGVERIEQVDQLRIEGCGEVQGFLYSKAVPAHELSDLRAPRPSLANIVQLPQRAERQRVNVAAKGEQRKAG
jgi:EAL domain-containing protein (putative c-di-GMP-specific phosphodiesterase class I)